jgi:hypothetical protein
MWILILNDMRSAKSEHLKPAARGATREALERLLLSEKVEPYREPGHNLYGEVNWGKSFRKGGPLEWFNAPSDYDIQSGDLFIDVDEWVAREKSRIDAQALELLSLPAATWEVVT